MVQQAAHHGQPICRRSVAQTSTLVRRPRPGTAQPHRHTAHSRHPQSPLLTALLSAPCRAPKFRDSSSFSVPGCACRPRTDTLPQSIISNLLICKSVIPNPIFVVMVARTTRRRTRPCRCRQRAGPCSRCRRSSSWPACTASPRLLQRASWL
jgi:hypothetical protein